jgi:hypothetical protein
MTKNMANSDSPAFFTIASRNYIAHYRVWRQSIARFHPEARIVLVLVDEPMDGDDLSVDDEVILARDIVGSDFVDMAVRYDVMELNTAVKARSFRYIFDQLKAEQVVYLDPDIVLYAPLDCVLEPFARGASAIVTPHVLQPLLDEFCPNDTHLLLSGTFNLGFLALAACPETFAFLDWWSKRLRFQCLSAVSDGLFTDQKWCDLLPSFMPALAIDRHAGANVAYWNLHQRPISRAANGDWSAAGERLLFFHYSGFSVEDPTIVSRHQNRLKWSDLGPAQELFLDYQRRLTGQKWDKVHRATYAYGALNGVPLSSPIRRLYGRLYPNGLGSQAIAELNVTKLCTAPAADWRRFRGLPINALAAQILSMRPDVQARFSKLAIRMPWGWWRYRRWLRRHAAKEYRIPTQLIAK